jgi:hypothetical protein
MVQLEVHYGGKDEFPDGPLGRFGTE